MSDDTNSVNPSQAQSNLTPAMPVLPEGIGMKFEEIAELLAKKHATKIEIGDPIMMLVTVQNASLHEHAKLFQAHQVALEKFMVSQTQNYVEGVASETETLSSELSRITNQGLLEPLIQFRRDMMWYGLTLILIGLINIFIFVRST